MSHFRNRLEIGIPFMFELDNWRKNMIIEGKKSLRNLKFEESMGMEVKCVILKLKA